MREYSVKLEAVPAVLMFRDDDSANPKSPWFAACTPDAPCITPGTYAFLGAAATLG
jgi:hypothetical protein